MEDLALRTSISIGTKENQIPLLFLLRILFCTGRYHVIIILRDLTLTPGTVDPEGWDFFDTNITVVKDRKVWKFSKMYLLSRANLIINQQVTRLGNVYTGPYPFGAPCV